MFLPTCIHFGHLFITFSCFYHFSVCIFASLWATFHIFLWTHSTFVGPYLITFEHLFTTFPRFSPLSNFLANTYFWPWLIIYRGLHVIHCFYQFLNIIDGSIALCKLSQLFAFVNYFRTIWGLVNVSFLDLTFCQTHQFQLYIYIYISNTHFHYHISACENMPSGFLPHGPAAGDTEFVLSTDTFPHQVTYTDWPYLGFGVTAAATSVTIIKSHVSSE